MELKRGSELEFGLGRERGTLSSSRRTDRGGPRRGWGTQEGELGPLCPSRRGPPGPRVFPWRGCARGDGKGVEQGGSPNEGQGQGQREHPWGLGASLH